VDRLGGWHERNRTIWRSLKSVAGKDWEARRETFICEEVVKKRESHKNRRREIEIKECVKAICKKKRGQGPPQIRGEGRNSRGEKGGAAK